MSLPSRQPLDPHLSTPSRLPSGRQNTVIPRESVPSHHPVLDATRADHRVPHPLLLDMPGRLSSALYRNILHLTAGCEAI
jgi:hypothetical protein